MPWFSLVLDLFIFVTPIEAMQYEGTGIQTQLLYLITSWPNLKWSPPKKLNSDVQQLPTIQPFSRISRKKKQCKFKRMQTCLHLPVVASNVWSKPGATSRPLPQLIPSGWFTHEKWVTFHSYVKFSESNPQAAVIWIQTSREFCLI